MKKSYSIILLFVGLIFTSFLHLSDQNLLIEDSQSVGELLIELGDAQRTTYLPRTSIPGVSAERGYEIITRGFTSKPNGGNSGKQSSHFVCTSCHNIDREDPDLTVNDPLARLLYTNEKELPFLQGTTLYGAVSRDSFYNGDYELKYGDLVKPARRDIREAIQLCAVECAQGRALKDWELESILTYMWEIDLKVSDLELSDPELSQLSGNSISKSTKRDIIQSKYLNQSSAHFVYPPDDWKEGYPYNGRISNGRMIYENSCLYCHYKQKYSFFHLDKTKMSTDYLAGKADGYGPKSIYQVIRWGVPSKSGKPSYMPQYTKERMSDQMVEDLRAYLEQ